MWLERPPREGRASFRAFRLRTGGAGPRAFRLLRALALRVRLRMIRARILRMAAVVNRTVPTIAVTMLIAFAMVSTPPVMVLMSMLKIMMFSPWS